MSVPPVPPCFSDLGKPAHDLLGKDYPIAQSALEVKTTTPNGVTFTVKGSKHDNKPTIDATAEAKYVDRKNGITFTQGWTHANALVSNLELSDQIVNGLKIDINTTLHPEQGKVTDEKPTALGKSAIFKLTHKYPGIHTRANVNLFHGPTVTADTVYGQDGFLVGAEAAYNASSGVLQRYSLGLGFSTPDYAVSCLAHDSLTKYTASYYHRVSRDVEAAGKAVYDSARHADGVKLEVGTKAYLDPAAFLKAKINSAGILSLGYTQSLRPGVKASFGLSLDTQSLSGSVTPATAHKVGASFTFEG